MAFRKQRSVQEFGLEMGVTVRDVDHTKSRGRGTKVVLLKVPPTYRPCHQPTGSVRRSVKVTGGT